MIRSRLSAYVAVMLLSLLSIVVLAPRSPAVERTPTWDCTGLTDGRCAVVRAAQSLIGTPYDFDAHDVTPGYGHATSAPGPTMAKGSAAKVDLQNGAIDCSGLARYAYYAAGIDFGTRATDQQIKLLVEVMTKSERPIPGDLVFWGVETSGGSMDYTDASGTNWDVQHVGVYVGTGASGQRLVIDSNSSGVQAPRGVWDGAQALIGYYTVPEDSAWYPLLNGGPVGSVNKAQSGEVWGQPESIIVSGLVIDEDNPAFHPPVTLEYEVNGVQHKFSSTAATWKNDDQRWEYKFVVSAREGDVVNFPKEVKVRGQSHDSAWATLGTMNFESTWVPRGSVNVATLGAEWQLPTSLVVTGKVTDPGAESSPVPVRLIYELDGQSFTATSTASKWLAGEGLWEYGFEVGVADSAGRLPKLGTVTVQAQDQDQGTWTTIGTSAVDVGKMPTGEISVATMGSPWDVPTHLVVSGLALDADTPSQAPLVYLWYTKADGTSATSGAAKLTWRSDVGKWEYKFDFDIADAQGNVPLVKRVGVYVFDTDYGLSGKGLKTDLGSKAVDVGALPTGSISVATMGSPWGVPTHLVVSGLALDADTPSQAPSVYLWYTKADGTSATSGAAKMTWRSDVGKWEYKFDLDLNDGSGYAPIVDRVGVYVYDTSLGNNGTGQKTDLGSKSVPRGTAPSGSISVATMGAKWNLPTHLIVTGLVIDADTTGIAPEIWLSMTHDDGTATTSSSSTVKWRSDVGKWEYKFDIDLADSQGNFSKVNTVRAYALDTSFGTELKTGLGVKSVS